MICWSRRCLWLLATLLFALPARADNLDNALLEQMPTLIKRCQARGVAKIAVLSFGLRQGGELVPATRAVLCDNLPARIENTLALKLKSRAPELLILQPREHALIRSGEAAELSAAECERFLQLAMTPAWGPTARTVPDALVFGEVTTGADRDSLQVTVRGADKDGNFDLIAFDVLTDRNLLVELGQGFSLGTAPVRGVTDKAIFERVQANVAQTLKRPPASAGQPPTRNIERVRVEPQTSPEFPVELTLFYDDCQQPMTLDDAGLGSHNYLAPDPAAEQSLTFGLRSRLARPAGVVLLVNGVSTLYEQQGEPAGLNKWALEPDVEYRVKGYHQRDKENYRAITALTENESQRRYEDLGGERFAGLIHLYVFRTYDEESESAPMFVESIGRLSSSTDLAARFTTLSGLQQAIARRSDLFPPGTRPLAGWGKELQETLAEKQLGKVILTDAMIVRYSTTKPTAIPKDGGE